MGVESSQAKEGHKRLKRLRAQLRDELTQTDDPKRIKAINRKLDKIDTVDPEKLLAILKLIAEIMGFIVLFLGKKPVA